MSEPKTIDFLIEPIEDNAVEVSTLEQEGNVTSLVVLDEVRTNAVQLFSREGGLDPIIEEIKRRVKSEVFDISTPKGRLRIGSVARDIGSAKVEMKGIAQKVSEDAQKVVDGVRKERMRMEKELDALRDEIKNPLVKWNEAEDARKAEHEADIISITQMATGSWADLSLEGLQRRRELLNGYVDKDWQEFVLRGEAALKESTLILDDWIAKKELWNQEQEELRIAREQREEAQRREEEEKRLAAEKAERERIEKEKQEAVDKARKEAEEKAERDKVEAENKRLADIAAATKAESDRQKKIKDDADAEEKARAANENHKKAINNEILKALMETVTTSEHHLKIIIIAIAQGKIPHTKINY